MSRDEPAYRPNELEIRPPLEGREVIRGLFPFDARHGFSLRAKTHEVRTLFRNAMLMVIEELSRPGFLLGYTSLSGIIIDQGYALRAFSCKGHLL